MTPKHLSAIVFAIYEAAIDASRWGAALSGVLDAVGGTNGALLTTDARSRALSAASVGADPTAVDQYNRYYGRLDPVASALERAQIGALLTGSMVISRGEQQRSEFYNDWAHPHEVGDGVFAKLARDGPGMSSIVLAAPLRSKPFGTQDRLRIFGLLVPHLQHAMLVRGRIGELRLERDSALHVLDRLPAGVVMASSTGQPLFVNRAAERMCGDADGLTLAATRLRATLPSADLALQQLIARAGDAEMPSGGSVRVERPSSRRPFLVVVTPLVGNPADAARPRPGVLLVIVDPERRMQLSRSRLERAFGLTRAEASVAMRIVDGHGLHVVANELSVTISTVRLHLQRVFEKTDTHRQAELVRLLGELSPAFGPCSASVSEDDASVFPSTRSTEGTIEHENRRVIILSEKCPDEHRD